MSQIASKRQSYHGVDEVAFKNHINEFQRFYTAHKSFCDEVAGLKPRIIYENEEHKQFFITKDNFIYAIRKLMSFVFDNLHYIKTVSDMRQMENSCYELERKFLEDNEYQLLANKSRSDREEVELTKMYITYVMEVYLLGNRLVNLLQNSIMISTSRVTKDIEYHNESSFFDELSKYRTEISESISNYRFSDTLIVLKKIIGYYYTYKILLKLEEQAQTDKILVLIRDAVLQEDVIRLIQYVKEERNLDKNQKEEMKNLHLGIKRALLKVYYITNKNLSGRKILPKIQRKVHIDKTLI